MSPRVRHTVAHVALGAQASHARVFVLPGPEPIEKKEPGKFEPSGVACPPPSCLEKETLRLLRSMKEIEIIWYLLIF